METQESAETKRRCGTCHWYWHGWCGCLFNEHDKEQRDPRDSGCGDWASKDAKSGVLSCGMVWKEYR